MKFSNCNGGISSGPSSEGRKTIPLSSHNAPGYIIVRYIGALHAFMVLHPSLVSSFYFNFQGECNKMVDNSAGTQSLRGIIHAIIKISWCKNKNKIPDSFADGESEWPARV